MVGPQPPRAWRPYGADREAQRRSPSPRRRRTTTTRAVVKKRPRSFEPSRARGTTRTYRARCRRAARVVWPSSRRARSPEIVLWLRSATSEVGVNSGRRLTSLAQPTANGAAPRASHIGETNRGRLLPVTRLDDIRELDDRSPRSGQQVVTAPLRRGRPPRSRSPRHRARRPSRSHRRRARPFGGDRDRA